MFVDGGGWRQPDEPSRRPPLTRRQENIISWLIVVNALVMLLAPIGGGTMIEAVLALFARW